MTETEPVTLPLRLEFTYQHGLGEFSAYFERLEQGVALASHCPICERTYFPPRAICQAGHTGLENRELPGTGKIISITNGLETKAFGTTESHTTVVLVLIDGADTVSFGRLEKTQQTPRPGDKVQLIGAGGKAA
ncbi:MAG: hypothetical protein MJA83_14795, partial [Gammaproteobacteria bacterium]|nr:hypothetical protein [Gammaproteobacteria bacterium]